ncbi:MAG: hypothetical protein COB22_06105 [Cycloclasticus sp.]|nr:MAG: hypothetical protein COB22_06105 [Cycloclasticus sp.]
MCLILLAHEYSAQYKFILLSNRDEYHQRPTKQAGFWPANSPIFGGIDEFAGGSWLSVDNTGRLAAITNVRKPPFNDTNKKSRGLIVKDFLSCQLSSREFISNLKTRDANIGLFNLLLRDKNELIYYTNDTQRISSIEPGIHGISNASLDTAWPKLTRGCELFKSTLNRATVGNSDYLKILQSQQRPVDKHLPQTGISLEFERLLSSIFIQSDDYGTRCSTIITIDYDNLLNFTEVSYDSSGQITGKVNQAILLGNSR